jgi:nickel-dependent lactate racemase
MTDIHPFTLPYGTGTVEFQLPSSYQTQVIAPQIVPAAPDPKAVVGEAIDHPLGAVALEDFRHARSVVIAINDKTRPVPHGDLLPPLLSRLEALGIPPQKITLLIATGTHLPMPSSEFWRVLSPELIERYPVVSHNTDSPDLVSLGVTNAGTPILVNHLWMQADARIVVGNIEPHHFMGFSGGVKTAAIGLGGRSTINHNHAMLSHPLARTGRYEDNPMRQDVEEIGKVIGVHFAVNAILNTDKKIVKVLAGNPVEVMQLGIQQARQLCQVNVSHTYDLVIASPGGYPKDINLYQSQKALTHAAMLARDNGVVILFAACSEGIGSTGYEHFMEGLSTFDQVFRKFSEQGFKVGPHKAFQIARDASRVRVILVSQMDPDLVRRLLLTPFSDLHSALEYAGSLLPVNAETAIMPIAVITIPVLI